jgi:hypothetical protein
VLRTGFCLKDFVFFVLLLPLLSILAIFSFSEATTTRGVEPLCQEECLATHSAKMKLLAKDYANTGDKMKYQDAVEDEAHRYLQCLTDCKELLPVK